MSLQSYLSRLVWICIAPMLALVAYFAIETIRDLDGDREREAQDLARNVAASIDRQLRSRVGAMQILALSPLVERSERWPELYASAQAFQQTFGSHLLLADASMRMLFNTRVPLGSALPRLPEVQGQAAAPTAIATGKPAVGDRFVGPVANVPMVAIAVPVMRDGRATHLLISTLEAEPFQRTLDELALPDDWVVTLLDGKGETIARRGAAPAADAAASTRRLTAGLANARWSVAIDQPRRMTIAGVLEPASSLALLILVATLVGLVGGRFAARRLQRSLSTLASPNSVEAARDATAGEITEVSAIRRHFVEVERRRRDSEARFLATFEQAAVGIAQVAPDGRWIKVNRKLCDIVGYPMDELLRKTFQDITHPDDLEADLGQVRAMLDGAIDTYSIEKRYLRGDGSHVWVNLTVSLVRHADGTPDYFVSVIEDITARKRAEESLRKVSLAVEQTPESIVIVDTDARIEYVNEAFLQATGYGRDEVIGENPRMLQSGLTPRETYAAMWAALTAGQTWRGEFVNRRKDGTEYVELAVISPLRQPDGRITHYVAVKQDITERRRIDAELDGHRRHLEQLVETRTAELEDANRALAERAREVADLYDQAPVGYHSLGPDGTIIAVNQTELALLGYARDEFVGHRLTEFLTAASVAEFQRRFPEFARDGQLREVELDFVRRDGSVLPVLVSANAVRDENGEYIASRSAVFDNRERKKRDLQIAQMQEELARRADEAEAANQAKSTFLANMSHEIRTPMNAILGFAHLLKRSELKPGQRERLDKISAAGEHLLLIINDILELSKIEAGKLVLEAVDFPLHSVLDGVRSLIGEQASAKGIGVAIDADGLPTWLRGDPTRLRQALLNFAGNAVKFTEHGSISLRAYRAAEDGDRICVRFEVRDSGIGIPPDKLAGLFQSFQQVDASTSRKYGGTGLGLAITRRIANAMGGDAGVESEEGVGSTFWFTAWLQRGEAIRPAVPEIARDAESELKRRHAGARVLLAEDDPVNQEVAKALLTDVGLRVDLASDGRQAVAMAANDYDLILMDMQMPGVNGLDATRAIRAIPGRATTPIVAMTANAFADDRRRCLDAGMNDFLAKPVNPDEVFAMLLKWLARRH